MNRVLKRIIIISVFLSFFVVSGFFIWIVTRKPATCSDGKKNGNEAGVDCGGVCKPCEIKRKIKPLEIIDKSIVYGGKDKYDAVVTIKNPNTLYGASTIRYTISLLSADGKIIMKKNGEGFILPTQERFFIETNIESDVVPKDLNISIDYVKWEKFVDYKDPDFLVQNVQFGKVKSGINYAKVFALIRNNSDFDFREVRVYAVIKDKNDKPIAVSATTIGNFLARDERDFTLTWPYRFPGIMNDVEIGVYANVFDSQNFVQQYLPANNPEIRE